MLVQPIAYPAHASGAGAHEMGQTKAERQTTKTGANPPPGVLKLVVCP